MTKVCGDCKNRGYIYGSGNKCWLIKSGKLTRYPSDKHKKGGSIGLKHPACSFFVKGAMPIQNIIDPG